jgi:glycosyltransferase involved in cell wall biosynthesis
VDDEVGGLFRPADPADLARVVTRLLCDADLRALGIRARERVAANWSNARLAARHLEIYEELIRRRRSA